MKVSSIQGMAASGGTSRQPSRIPSIQAAGLGAQARRQGIDHDANPYYLPHEEAERRGWADGWMRENIRQIRHDIAVHA